MRVIKFTGQQQNEPREIPNEEDLEGLIQEGLLAEFVRRILEWKGRADYEYFRTQWDLHPNQVDEAIELLEDVETVQLNST
jgi:hypothetical protein